MQIKQQMLAQQVQKKIAPLYFLIGQDPYLLNESLATIKAAIKKQSECDEKNIAISTADDWELITEATSNYSLFSETTLLNIFFDKKSIDAAGKKILTEYLNSVPSHSFIIIRAPNVPAKQVQWLSSHEHAIVSVAYPFNAAAMKQWIAHQLRNNGNDFDPHVTDIIYQYTQGNMLACAQAIEKIALSYPNQKITVQEAQEHLFDQSEYQLFELIEACLLRQGDKAIQILRHAANNKTEPTLVLWLLTQEVRTLLQLIRLLEQRIDTKTACSQIKIWPQRINLYQAYCNRHPYKESLKILFQKLHQYCYSIDEAIKSNFNSQVWNSLENLALSISLGQLIGDTCTA